MAAPENDPSLSRLRAIGAQIRRLREKRGLSQQQLGEKTRPPGKEEGIHYNVVGDYERGEGGGFSILTAIAMAEALDVPLDQLVGRRDAPPPVPLVRDEVLRFQRPKVMAALREAKRTGKWDNVKKYFGVGFGYGIVLEPEDAQVSESQAQEDLALVLDATKKIGLERLRKWCEEEVSRGYSGSGGSKTK